MLSSSIGEASLRMLIGLASGMLVNYLADVLPYRRKLVRPFCLVCGERQSIVNYLFWPRRCEHCQNGRPWRTWLVEIGMAMAWVALLVVPSGRLGFVRGMILLIYFALVAIIDFEHRLILHRVSGLGAMLALWLGWELHGLPETLAGGITGLGVMLGLYLLGALLMGWLAKLRGQVLKEEALGFGDIILGGILGMLLGWPGILAGLMLTILLAGAASLIYLGIMLANKRYRSDLAIAYGPYMVLSGFILLYL